LKEWKYYNEVKSILNTINEYKSAVIFDLETTGFSKKNDRIIQFSAIRFSIPEFNEMERLDIYIKCPFKINGTEASNINHITDELLEEKGIDEYDAFSIISKFIKSDDIIMGYNNSRFDNPFMEEFYNRFHQEFTYKQNIDIYQFAKIIVPAEAMKIKDESGKDKVSYKLEYVTKYYNPETDVLFHSAIEDVAATGYVLKNIILDANSMINEFENNENKRKEIPRQDAKVWYINLFNPSKNLKRVYVKTDQGTVYYDDVQKKWRAKTGSVDSLNMEGIVKQVFEQLKITSEAELFNAVVLKDKLDKAKQLFGFKSLYYSEDQLNQKYEALLKEDPENEKRVKEIKSAYARLKKNGIYTSENCA